MKQEIMALSRLLEDQKSTIANLIAMKKNESSSDNNSNKPLDMDTFRAQSARVENDLKELERKTSAYEIQISELKNEAANKDLELSKNKLSLEKLKNELET